VERERNRLLAVAAVTCLIILSGCPTRQHNTTVLKHKSGPRVENRQPCGVERVEECKRDPYLLVVSFYTKKAYTKIDDDFIARINRTPYDGVAVFLDNHQALPRTIARSTLETTLSRVSRKSKKHIWPWIFFNRFVGGVPLETKVHRALKPTVIKHFERIPGLDLDDTFGTLTTFKRDLRLALRIARETSVPGIVIDPEAYNNNKTGRVSNLAKVMHRSEKDIILDLKRIGAELARIVDAEYPRAVLWFLTGDPKLSTTYIIQGILDEASQRRFALTVVEGGEHTVGYVHQTVGSLSERISSQRATFSKWESMYRGSFALGGTISPTDDPNLRTGWIDRTYDRSLVESIDDLEPMFRELFFTYDYVWIYAAIATKYNPFDQKLAEPYHRSLRSILSHIRPKMTCNPLRRSLWRGDHRAGGAVLRQEKIE
jgi:hypothetical protein